MKEEEKEQQYNFTESYLYPIVILENVFSSRARRGLYRISVWSLRFCTLVVLWIILLNRFALLDGEIGLVLDTLLPKIIGFTLIMLALWIVARSLEAFFCSFYFKEKETEQVSGRDHIPEDMFSFHVLRIFSGTRNNDITKGLLVSWEGIEIFRRSGLEEDDIITFLNARESSIPYKYPEVKMDKVFTLVDLVSYVFEKDTALADFLFKHGVKEKELIGATNWVVSINEEEKKQKRWWTRESLERIAGIGSDWSYGQAYTLNHFAKEITGREGGAALNALSDVGKNYLRVLKETLARTRESNVLLVGEPGGGKMNIVTALARDLRVGSVPPALERKRPMLLDAEFLVSQTRDKSNFEVMLVKILNDAVSAGNIILIFNNFPAFVLSANANGSDVVSLMDPYFDSPGIQIITLSDRENYHRYLEQDPRIMQRFERIIIEQPEDTEMIEILENVAEELERQSGVTFTYGSIKTVISSVNNYFSDPIMPDKAIDLLVELPARVLGKRKLLVKKEDVLELVQQKTGIPLGEIQDREREALLHLEELLHERVVGQDEAITSVSNAMRRSRAGVHNEKRPIGSFLFIGPTGVGKTETAKSLAHVFFGNEDSLSRLDMSEFTGEDALHRLIGSFEDSRVGLLTKAIKERPYGVILLDEFEKSSSEVHDLFLQILDEGFFSDMKGKRVNARSSIFVATSNAGSDHIYQLMKNEIDPNDTRDEVISRIIKDGIFKPEFINRFDAVILFHPLGEEHAEKIATIMLDRFKKRLHGRGLDLEITPELTKYVAKQGFDSVFGARPMSRYIQENVEQIVADKLIKGEIKEGTRFKLYPHDLKGGPIPHPERSSEEAIHKAGDYNPFPHIKKDTKKED